MRLDHGGFQIDDQTRSKLGSVMPAFGVSRFGIAGGQSRSGHERNRLFLSEFSKREQFLDVSGISGTDSAADGRAVAFWDYDYDGWVDMAVVNANAPLLQVFRNRLGDNDLFSSEDAASPGQRGMIAVRLYGGNRSSSASKEWSAREGYGAQVTASVGSLRMFRELRAGEGLAAQNSRTLLFGLGSAAAVDSLEVRWLSGQTQEFKNLPAGSLVSIHENASESADGSGMSLEPYAKTPGAPVPEYVPEQGQRMPIALPIESAKPDSDLVMYTTMTATCESCIAELPELEHLRAELDASQLSMLAIPMDPEDSPQDLDSWTKERQPVYELLEGLASEEVESVRSLVVQNLKEDATPATIVADREGRILLMRFGAPTLSELRRLLD